MRATAAILTVGGRTFDRCRAALEGQPCIVEVVANVTPFAAAMNEAVRRCRTELLVQVDDDMILEPDAIERLVALMDEQPGDVVMATLPLYDEDLEMVIFGVKVYRTELLRPVPFEHHILGDMHDREVWARHGLRTAKGRRVAEQVIGRHGTDYTPEQSFQRWRALWQRHRRTGRLAWIEPWLEKLAERHRRTGSRRDLYAFAGALLGTTEPLWPDDAGPDAARADAALAELVRRFPAPAVPSDVDTLSPA